MVPMLDEAIEIAAAAGAHEVVIGMAHRGRLNVLVHTVGRSYESILREFEGERTIEAVVTNDEGGTGDVKYHLAATGTRATASGEVTVTLAPNPSHLEAVDPVVEGWTRAEQTDRSFGSGIHDPSVALPVLIHGDASFAGQGVVAETLNLSNLDGYTTGGTLHLIANNQVGFTTDPAEGRSTRYSSDLAKGFDIPIVHVNADDPEAAVSAIRLAMAYRQEFGHDIVVDLIGYRRFGHNEQDEAAYTQPLMVAQIEARPTVREQYAAQLVEEGVVTEEQAAAVFDEVQAELRAAHEQLKASIAVPRPIKEGRIPADTGEAVVTAVPAERLELLNEQLLAVPEDFEGNAKLLKQLERRRETIREGGIDWGQGERARAREPPHGGHSDPALGPGHRARDVLAPARDAPRSAHRRDATRRSSTSPTRQRRSRSTTRRCPSTPVSASSTAMRSPPPTRSCSGRRSSATSSTARRSSSTSSSSPGSRSGARRHA